MSCLKLKLNLVKVRKYNFSKLTADVYDTNDPLLTLFLQWNSYFLV